MSAPLCEEENFSTVYQQNAVHVRNFAYYKCGDLDVAEDITQESFVRLWHKCREVVIGKAKSWLFTVANRIFLDRVKSEKVALRFEKSQLPQSDREDPFFALRTKEFREKIETAISELPERQREVFLMNRIDKLSYQEIGHTLGISQTAVEKRMAKALRNLKNKIEEFKTYGI